MREKIGRGERDRGRGRGKRGEVGRGREGGRKVRREVVEERYIVGGREGGREVSVRERGDRGRGVRRREGSERKGDITRYGYTAIIIHTYT